MLPRAREDTGGRTFCQSCTVTIGTRTAVSGSFSRYPVSLSVTLRVSGLLSGRLPSQTLWHAKRHGASKVGMRLWLSVNMCSANPIATAAYVHPCGHRSKIDARLSRDVHALQEARDDRGRQDAVPLR